MNTKSYFDQPTISSLVNTFKWLEKQPWYATALQDAINKTLQSQKKPVRTN